MQSTQFMEWQMCRSRITLQQRPTWGSTSWEKITGNVPNDVFEAKSPALQKQTNSDRKRKASEEAKQQRKKAKFASSDDDVNSRRAYSRHDGTVEVDDVPADLPPSDLQDLMIRYYRANVMINETKARSIQLTTTKHSSNSRSSALRNEERRLRVTSSNVGTIARRRSTTKVGPLVHQLLYSSFKGNKATSWGLLQEEDTEKQYQDHMKQSCKDFSVSGDCGLVCPHSIHGWLPHQMALSMIQMPPLKMGWWSTKTPMPAEIVRLRRPSRANKLNFLL